MEKYLSDIIYYINDAIIVFDYDCIIKVFNHAAELLFEKNQKEVIGKPLSYICDGFPYEVLLEKKIFQKQIYCTIKNKIKNLFVSKSSFIDKGGRKNHILMIQDFIKLQSLQENIHHNDLISAVCHLANGIAHEIRNPLNTISTIIQQLGKDFEPKKDISEYNQLVELVYKDVKRINKIIKDFVNFSHPRSPNPHFFKFSDLTNNLLKHYQPLLKKNHLYLQIYQSWDGEVCWDIEQIKLVFMNLIQNAMDALSPNGKILITIIEIDEDELEIRVNDNGPGVADKIRSNIFNLYFTTKPQPTGIGLCIIQQIVYAHNGSIFLSNEKKDMGATFILRMPKKLKEKKGVLL